MLERARRRLRATTTSAPRRPSHHATGTLQTLGCSGALLRLRPWAKMRRASRAPACAAARARSRLSLGSCGLGKRDWKKSTREPPGNAPSHPRARVGQRASTRWARAGALTRARRYRRRPAVPTQQRVGGGGSPAPCVCSSIPVCPAPTLPTCALPPSPSTLSNLPLQTGALPPPQTSRALLSLNTLLSCKPRLVRKINRFVDGPRRNSGRGRH
jgi:hypothetical protein